jgi:predicted membrane-bound spermidine synthase
MERRRRAAYVSRVTSAIWAFAATLVMLAVARVALARRARVLASASVPDGEIVVRDRRGHREMLLRGAREMVWTRVSLADPCVSGFAYVDLFHLAAVAARSRRRTLFIGCGGALAPRQWSHVYPGISIDLVEHERAVVDLARRHFDLDAIPRLSVHIADGVAFVADAPAGTWDVAVVDAYGALELPGAMSQQAFFTALHRALRPGGAMAINVVGHLSGPGPVRSVVDAVRAVFGEARAVPVVELDDDADVLRNVVVIARRAG